MLCIGVYIYTYLYICKPHGIHKSKIYIMNTQKREKNPNTTLKVVINHKGSKQKKKRKKRTAK